MKDQSGLSLIELIVAVAIIGVGILAATASYSYISSSLPDFKTKKH